MITKNLEIVVDIIDMGINGEGIAKYDGAVIFVPFAIIGEKVKIHIIYAKSKYYVGKIIEIINASPYRITPPCPYFTKCGGCNLQHINDQYKLKLKTDLVKNALRNIAKVDNAKVNDCISLNTYHYRNKFAFPIGDNGKEKYIGMYKDNSHDIIKIDDCLIQESWAKTVIDIFNDFLKLNLNSVYSDKNHSGLIKHLVCRMDKTLLVCVVINGKSLNNSEYLVDNLKKHFSSFGLMLNINTLNNNVILTDDYKYLYGEKSIVKKDDLEYTIDLNSFMQVNTAIADKIYENVQNQITNEIVVNAFSGAGLLSGYLCKTAKHVYGIEIVKSSHLNAEYLKQKNNIVNLTNILGDVSDILPTIKNFNYIILDPPRKGCSKSVIDTILNVSPKHIIYISCDPATLSRDIGLLKEKYSLVSATPYDMFPQTKHVETLAILNLKD